MRILTQTSPLAETQGQSTRRAKTYPHRPSLDYRPGAAGPLPDWTLASAYARLPGSERRAGGHSPTDCSPSKLLKAWLARR